MDTQNNKNRPAEECEKLDKDFERQLAEELLAGEVRPTG